MKLPNQILYATDLQPDAETMCQYVLGLAGQLGVHVLHVLDPPALTAVSPTHGSSAEEALLEDATRQIRERITALEGEAHRVSGLNVVPGITTEAILAEDDRVGADMIAIRNSDNGILSRLLHGSVASSLLRGSSVPDLVVPPGVDTADPKH